MADYFSMSLKHGTTFNCLCFCRGYKTRFDWMNLFITHYNDVIMSALVSLITNCLFRCRSKKASKLRVTGLCVRGIHRWPVNSPHKGPVTRKMFPFDDVIMPHVLDSSQSNRWPLITRFTLQINHTATIHTWIAGNFLTPTRRSVFHTDWLIIWPWAILWKITVTYQQCTVPGSSRWKSYWSSILDVDFLTEM